MKIRLLVLIALLSLCPAAAYATTLMYGAVLGDFENPANGTPGTGSARIIIDDVAHTMSVDITFSGLLGTTTASHIHCCAVPPANAMVATQTPSFIGFPLGVTSGAYFNTFDLTDPGSWRAGFIAANGGTPLGAEAALLAGLEDGQAYLNIHTSVYAGGEIRGFLEPVPEPTSVSLLGLGLAIGGWKAWRAKRRAA